MIENLKRKEPILHLIFWSIYFIYPWLKSFSPTGNGFSPVNQVNDMLFGMVIFYVAYLKLFTSSRGTLLIALPILFVSMGFLNLRVHDLISLGLHQESFIYYALSYISTYAVLVLFAYALFSVKEVYRNQKLLNEALSEKQKAQVASLKFQINPHFLFNTLNTIYEAALNKNDKTPDLILKLSDSFRYVITKGQKEVVALSDEIRHIKDFVELQKERLRDRVDIEWHEEIDDYDISIPPLLLISFVENAFKYSSSLKGKNNLILIKLKLKENHFQFQCENTYHRSERGAVDSDWIKSGIGIKNAKSRLQLHYPDRHKLELYSVKDQFKVKLDIRL